MAVVLSAVGDIEAAVTVRSRLTKRRMADLFSDIELWDEVVAKLYFNPLDVADLYVPEWRDTFDREYNRPILEQGIVGFLWGALVYEDASVPVGYVGMASGLEGDQRLEGPVRLRSLGSAVVKRRQFKGSFRDDFHIEVWGEHRVEMLPEGFEAHVYEFKGWKRPFIRSYAHELSDQEVIDQLLEQLVPRATKHPGKMVGPLSVSPWPIWLFRTSVRHYRVRREGFLGIDHTDRDVRLLIESGKIGPVV